MIAAARRGQCGVIVPPDDRQGSGLGTPRALFGLGFEIAVPVVLFIYLGYRLDGWLGSEPWLLVLGALLGATLGAYGFARRVLPPKRGRGGDGS